jgi:hypothetical protein
VDVKGAQILRERLIANALEKSPSGASLICCHCGTIYDNHPLVGEVPPVGDGCEYCDPDSLETTE